MTEGYWKLFYVSKSQLALYCDQGFPKDATLAKMTILASEALLHENKNSSNNMLLPVMIETGPLINLLPQVQHSPF